MNFTQYNYFVWADVLRVWFGGRETDLGTVLDIGCGNGKWLEELARADLLSQGIGLDIAAPIQKTNHKIAGASFELHQADFLKPLEVDGYEGVQTICLMNMIYVLPTNDHISNFIRETRPKNIILSVPRQSALDIYDRRHRGKNFYGRTIEGFVSDLGYEIVERQSVCSFYYLVNPVPVLVGGLSRRIAKVLENSRPSGPKYYDLIWLSLDASS